MAQSDEALVKSEEPSAEEGCVCQTSGLSSPCQQHDAEVLNAKRWLVQFRK